MGTRKNPDNHAYRFRGRGIGSASGQRPVSCMVHRHINLLLTSEGALKHLGFARSEFIRAAIYEKLERDLDVRLIADKGYIGELTIEQFVQDKEQENCPL